MRAIVSEGYVLIAVPFLLLIYLALVEIDWHGIWARLATNERKR